MAAMSRSPAAKIEHLEPTAAELRGLGVRALAKAADVRDPAAVNDMLSTVVGELGRLDILGQRRRRQFHLPRRKPVAERFRHRGRHRSEGDVQRVDARRCRICKARGGVVLNISATLPYLGTHRAVACRRGEGGRSIR